MAVAGTTTERKASRRSTKLRARTMPMTHGVRAFTASM